MAGKFVLVKHLHSCLNGDSTVLDIFVTLGMSLHSKFETWISDAKRLVDVGAQECMVRISCESVQTFNGFQSVIPDLAKGKVEQSPMSYHESLMFSQQPDVMILC